MKQLIIVVLLSLSTSAWAEWTPVDYNYAVFAYADRNTIRKVGNMVKMWQLFDYRAGQGSPTQPYLSVKAQWEYDCDGERQRMLYAQLLSANMDRGQIIYSGAEPKWGPVPPGSIGETLWKTACKQ
jgi:hypothetical protein